jgi:DNA-binding YbaB/EbfC family protein
MKGPMAQLAAQAQQLQENMKRAQDEIANMEITGESGAGMVKVTVNGRHEARRVQIAADAMTEDKEFLEDLIAAAINDAAHKLEQATRARMEKVTGGLKLPPGMNLGF